MAYRERRRAAVGVDRLRAALAPTRLYNAASQRGALPEIRAVVHDYRRGTTQRPDADPPPDARPVSLTSEIALRHRQFEPSERQLDCLATRAAGYSRKEGAAIIGISPSTFRSHMRLLLVGSHCADDAAAVHKYRHELADRVKP
jgi:hypothetical protein